MRNIGIRPSPNALTLFSSGDSGENVNASLPNRIERFDRLKPFLVNVVSDTDLWMYASSTGALTAGRINEDCALFPYETDDKLHQHGAITGPTTYFRVKTSPAADPILWRPFAGTGPSVRRTLAKSTLGNALCFEEINDALGLSFRYTWSACNEFGWVRTCEIESRRKETLSIEVVDGVINLLPANAPLALQRASSCLINAYSQAELDLPTNLAVYSLASQIIDRAEPAEALHANIAYQIGLQDTKHLLSADQLESFLAGEALADEHLLTGRRPAFLVGSKFDLDAGESRQWRIVLDAYRTQSQVIQIQTLLNTESISALTARIDAALAKAARKLHRIVSNTDGQQKTNDSTICAHHASNVLFNDLRGGVFMENDVVEVADFRRAITARNQVVTAKHLAWLDELPERIGYADLLRQVSSQNDAQLRRLSLEYLPLTFGRRHGDPSRPWNRFEIRVIDELGTPILNYQGNWRDIFQNWEALVMGTPVFVESMIAKFVNASTLDGFNPYRVLRDGIEWEVPDPHDPWAHIGYWGDHQIIYLLKLLESSHGVHAGTLGTMLGERCFSYANVPYRMKPFAAMLADRHQTIDFDWPTHREIESSLNKIGTDARLVRDDSGNVVLVNLAEKLLVPALSKLSSFVPGGGIWMNTQRPEWNDANNALVGNGLSVVTLCYLRRYLTFCARLFAEQKTPAFELRTDVAGWLGQIAQVLQANRPAPHDAVHRMTILRALGMAFETYRNAAYAKPALTAVPIDQAQLAAFFAACLEHVDASIVHQRRQDGLFHAYNLMGTAGGAVEVGHLPIMLEGQVAAISSGVLTPADAANVVERMFSSALWRDDQRSFMLYPIQELPGFLQKNAVKGISVLRSTFARQLLETGDHTILSRDPTGQVRFNAAFKSERDVRSALDRLARHSDWTQALETGRQEILDLYEDTFAHHSFTGRSGSMYCYEGVGCIYWHMVAKLLLAVQENLGRAVADGASSDLLDRLATLYERVRAGLGFNKTPEMYGAFPVDAYSHTPLHAGAQQPGMTGQVKEEILTRFGELGVSYAGGKVRFAPILLHTHEFFEVATDWDVVGLDGADQTIALPADSLGFTLAATPIVYHLDDSSAARIEVRLTDGSTKAFASDTLDAETSKQLLSRTGEIDLITVAIPNRVLRV